MAAVTTQLLGSEFAFSWCGLDISMEL